MIEKAAENIRESPVERGFVYCPGYSRNESDSMMKSFKRKTDAQYDKTHAQEELVFERKHLKDIIHTLTSEIKQRGTKIPLLVLPFRSQEIDDEDGLNKLVGALVHNGRPRGIVDIEKAIKSTENVYTLMSTLKYFWCRLPGNAIIGWKAYTKFVKLEEESNFTKKSFLEFMPNCLSSGAHASIVYDFFDLIVALVINSKKNLMSSRKLCRLMGLWAFNPIRNAPTGEPSFERGLFEWIPSSDAMFHLLLSFLRSMPPGGDINKLPSTFQVLLKANEYPPASTSSQLEHSKTQIEVPLITLKSNNPSKNPAELIAKVSKTLKFDDATLFKTREDYLLLKRLFKDSDGEIINKLSQEGQRILENLCLSDNGCSTSMTGQEKVSSSGADFFTAEIHRISIDDYYIWTWLASLGDEETDLKRRTFGKSYIMEVELAEGFKKWVILEEQDVERDGYDIELELKQEKLKELNAKIQQAQMKMKQPPPPLPKDYGIPERSNKRPVVLPDDEILNTDTIRLEQQYAKGIRLSLKNDLDDDNDDFLKDDFLDAEIRRLAISHNTRLEEEDKLQKAKEKERIEMEVKKQMEREKIEREAKEKIEREAKEKIEMEARVREDMKLRESQEHERALRAKDLEIQRQKELELQKKKEYELREKTRRDMELRERQRVEYEQRERQRVEYEQRERQRVEYEKRERQRVEQERLAMEAQHVKDIKRAKEVREMQTIEVRERELKERERQLALKEQQLMQQQQQVPLRSHQPPVGIMPMVSPPQSSSSTTPPQTQPSQQIQSPPPPPPQQQQQQHHQQHHQQQQQQQQRYLNSPVPGQQQRQRFHPQNTSSAGMASEYATSSVYSSQPFFEPGSSLPPPANGYHRGMGSPPPQQFHYHMPVGGPPTPKMGTPNGSPMMPGKGYGNEVNHSINGYSSAVISQMPTQGKVNKRQARDAFMGNGFGI